MNEREEYGMRFKGKSMKCFVAGMAALMSASVLLTTGDASAANWPEKGKVITVYVPTGAGGGADTNIRLILPFLEKEFGVKTVVINKAGGGGAIGIQEFLQKSRTDGYTLLATILPGQPTTYLDPERKAPYGRNDFILAANVTFNPAAIAVIKSSRYKTLKDLIEAARANPRKIKVTSAGPLNASDMGELALEKVAGVQFAHMFFDQQGEQRAALLGGHVDAEANTLPELVAGHKGGEIEVLAVLDDRESKYIPGAKTAESQGYKAYSYSCVGFGFKAGTPKEIVDTFATAVKKASAEPEFQRLVEKLGTTIRVLTGKDYDNLWRQTEEMDKEALDLLRHQKK
jgi:tripartite-type tricarboxylate transporter receptor subunit TctC